MTWSKTARRHLVPAQVLRTFLFTLILAGSLLSGEAKAQVGQETAPASPKATIGLALLGGEAVMSVQAAVGFDRWWIYAIGGGVGAIGGGVGGYFIDRADNAPISASLLVGGVVFAVPATIAVLNAAAYKPPKNPEIDDGSTAAERAEERMHLAAYQPIPSLVDVNQKGKMKVKMPAVTVQPVFSSSARQRYDLPSAASVRVPVFHLTF